LDHTPTETDARDSKRPHLLTDDDAPDWPQRHAENTDCDAKRSYFGRALPQPALQLDENRARGKVFVERSGPTERSERRRWTGVSTLKPGMNARPRTSSSLSKK
jgi:hypothetical protein